MKWELFSLALAFANEHEFLQQRDRIAVRFGYDGAMKAVNGFSLTKMKIESLMNQD